MGKANSKKVGRVERSGPKPRPAPAFDAAKKKLAELKDDALAKHWSPLETRRRIASERNVSRGPWRRAVKAVFGAGVLELPDLRQLDLFSEVA